jgi:hypothetical protein
MNLVHPFLNSNTQTKFKFKSRKKKKEKGNNEEGLAASQPMSQPSTLQPPARFPVFLAATATGPHTSVTPSTVSSSSPTPQPPRN